MKAHVRADPVAEALLRALEKAERYRLLNEPGEAESSASVFVRDNQQALGRVGPHHAPTPRGAAELRGEYERAYYAGIISERRAKAPWRAAVWLRLAATRAARAWREYEKAEGLRWPATTTRPRWNAARRSWTTRSCSLPPGRAELPLE
jgi:hypothetical protein